MTLTYFISAGRRHETFPPKTISASGRERSRAHVSQIASAQTYPARPITLVIPFAPGGANDVIGRVLAPRMRASLGQPIIIETVAGAGGSLGTGRVARAAPDGYTVIVGNGGTHAINGLTSSSTMC